MTAHPISNVDLFGNPTLIGLKVKLDRPVDRERAVLQQRLYHRRGARAPCRQTDLHRLRFAPWLAQQIHCTLDRARDHALRRAEHADRGAQVSHIRRGGARQTPTHTELILNLNLSLRLSAKGR